MIEKNENEMATAEKVRERYGVVVELKKDTR